MQKFVTVSQKPSDRKQEWRIPKRRDCQALKGNSVTSDVTTALEKTLFITAASS